MPSDDLSNPVNALPWYALQVASRCEKTVSIGLVLRGYSEFLPLFRSRRKWSDRVQDVDLPLFPGYVFCQLDVNRRLPVLLVPGVVRIVGVGKIPMPVDDSEITAVQTVVRSGLFLQPWPFLKVGQTVTIEEGPLRNVTGILTGMNGSEQLIVSISLLQRSLAVTIPRGSIRPAGNGRRHFRRPLSNIGRRLSAVQSRNPRSRSSNPGSKGKEVPVFKTRTRMVSFRLSEDEYERLKEISLMERARSVSEFARAALCRLPEAGCDSALIAAPKMEQLEGALSQLKQEVHHLRQLVETGLGPTQGAVAAASLQTNSK